MTKWTVEIYVGDEILVITSRDKRFYDEVVFSKDEGEELARYLSELAHEILGYNS